MDPLEHVLAQWRTERPDLDVSPIAIFGRVQRVSGLATRNLQGYLARFGLTRLSFDILANLRRSGPPYRKTPSELAASSLLTTGAMTGRLDAMEADGLISRIRSPEDRRVSYAALTEHGKQLIDEVIGVHLEEEQRLLESLTPQKRQRIADCLAELEEAVLAALPEEERGRGAAR